MAIEGPLRELGIHDVFQLIDLSRKTGLLRVSSELRDDEGLVYFTSGRVVQATVRSAQCGASAGPAHTGRASVSIANTKRERERQARAQIESAVFELMSWREGFFSFEELMADDMPADCIVSVPTASLLMEGARRIDEWSRIAQIVPTVAAVPELAPVEPDREGPMLDLLPHEWQVLTMIDGDRDLRGIATDLGRDEFEIAKVAYGLATTGIIVLRSLPRVVAEPDDPDVESRLAAAHLDAALAAVRAGDFVAARASCEQVLRLVPGESAATRAQEALDAIAQLERVLAGSEGAHVHA